ncbi:MAG: GumC family protein [Myxococcota bacterium]
MTPVGHTGRQSEDRYPPDAPIVEPETRRPGFPVHPYRVYRALWTGRFWLLGAAVLGAALGLAIAKLGVGDSYRSSVVLSYRGVPNLEGDRSRQPSELGGMAEAFHLEPVLEDVQERLGLQDGSLTALRNQLDVQPDASGSTVRVETTGSTPEEATRLGDAAAEAFMDYHRRRREAQLREELERVDERVLAARRALSRTRTAYNEFRELHDITDLSAEQQRSIESAAELRARKDTTESEVKALEARIEQLQNNLRNSPRMVVTSSGSSSIARDLSEAQAELSAARSNLSPDHPKVQTLERRVQTLRLRMRSGGGDTRGNEQMGTNSPRQALQTALDEAEADLQAAKQRQESLAALAEEAREQVDGYSEIEGEASALLAQVRVQEQLVNDLESTQAQLQDLLRQPSSGFQLLTPAAMPDSPESSRGRKLAVVGAPALLLLAVLVTLLGRELWGLRVWTPAETAYWGRAAVVGATGWPRDPYGMETLVSDLDDLAPSARGEMLVVPATEEARELAEEVAEWLREDWHDTRLFGQDSDLSYATPPLQPAVGVGSDLPALVRLEDAKALAVARPSKVREVDSEVRELCRPLQVRAWHGPVEGQSLRRAARLCERVLVVVPAGQVTMSRLLGTANRLGRADGHAFVLVGVPESLAHLADRVGPVEHFFRMET